MYKIIFTIVICFVSVVGIYNDVSAQLEDDVSECYSDNTKTGDCWYDENYIHYDISIPVINIETENSQTYKLQMYIDKNWNKKFTRQDRGNKEYGCGHDAHIEWEWVNSFVPSDIYEEQPVRAFKIYKSGQLISIVDANRCGTANVVLNKNQSYNIVAVYHYQNDNFTGYTFELNVVSDGKGGSVNIPVYRIIYLPMVMK